MLCAKNADAMSLIGKDISRTFGSADRLNAVIVRMWAGPDAIEGEETVNPGVMLVSCT